jgi:hypothetical protein
MMKFVSNNYVRQKHGKSETSEYRAWYSMIYRCYSSKCTSYTHYGARKIRVCDRWRTSFLNFLEDMGRKPSPSFSLERINNDGNYEPKNCKWATRNEQSNNTRSAQRKRVKLVWVKKPTKKKASPTFKGPDLFA